MKPETQLIKAALAAKYELDTFLACCSAKEIRDSFRASVRASDRVGRAVRRMKGAK